MYETIRFIKVLKNVIIIELSRYMPSVKWKHFIYRKGLNMKIGQETAFAFKATPDIMYPELITIGENCIIGYNATILCHEYLVEEYRIGNVNIGNNVLIGANATVLAGVNIGNNAAIASGTIVTKDVPDGMMAYGNPMQLKQRW
ncbi:acetyltransferase [Mammaliicoccus fleurettii]|uniref:Acetyltransferase n=2 Tax=Staphylococcaceae TaxID=90964 RepID=A0ABS5MLL2_9STAP|nr:MULTISPECIES: DapH/DapD/GlmU-related protein [Mammaliicoccus]MBL0846973.1 acetyltransferase [Mammaliicoccus fleurettii]MBO3063273.1 acetyltransferase [Mammaliicoccus fleurettii]MBS3671697.1 acetyltransferase [Mammaliicoccus fleurettii]MBS3696805.1 acetyltransferase [Mammaliicoccus fleurettii]MEB6202211.1 acetyltransferase [Mammaliicoccus fleurettii]